MGVVTICTCIHKISSGLSSVSCSSESKAAGKSNENRSESLLYSAVSRISAHLFAMASKGVNGRQFGERARGFGQPSKEKSFGKAGRNSQI